jgi:sulfonate transport system ATP-binding protein
MSFLRDISLAVAAGEVVAIIGASGGGKSTLLRLVAGLDAPTTGAIRIGGKPVTGIDLRSAIVFQEPRLLPWRTLADNVALGLPAGRSSAAGEGLVSHLLGLRTPGSRARPRQSVGAMPPETSRGR